MSACNFDHTESAAISTASARPCSFDRVAPFYPFLETLVFGRKLTRARNAALETITPDAEILLLGEGNGRFLTELFVRFPNARVTCVEPSSGMRAAQRKRLLRRLGRIPDSLQWVEERIQDWKAPEARYDVIVSHFFLDLFSVDEIGPVAQTLARAAAPGCSLCVAEFEELPTPLKRLLSQTLIRVMYLFFELSAGLNTNRIPPWPQALAAAGWAQRADSAVPPSLVRSSVWNRDASGPRPS